MPHILDNPQLVRDTLATIRDLDIAIAHHIEWLKGVHGALVCGTPSNPDNLEHNAHHRCAFGNWYYSVGKDYTDEPGYAEIGIFHKDMHDAARLVLEHRQNGVSIQQAEYEHFMDLAIRFKQQVHNFEHALIHKVCTIDHLTGAWNRQAMVMKLAEEQERVQRGGQPCSVCMVDIDHFKRINDLYGHLKGDEVLQAFSSLVSQALRKYDALFRFGGEEFLILMPETTLENAGALLNRIREKLSQTELAHALDIPIGLTASFGVALLSAGDQIDDVMERADHALLSAKANGRNRVCLWDMNPPMDE